MSDLYLGVLLAVSAVLLLLVILAIVAIVSLWVFVVKFNKLSAERIDGGVYVHGSFK